MTDGWSLVRELFLALDAELLPAWRGSSGDVFEEVVVPLDQDVTSLPVGAGTAALIATAPFVSDEGWLKVFRAADAAAPSPSSRRGVPTTLPSSRLRWPTRRRTGASTSTTSQASRGGSWSATIPREVADRRPPMTAVTDRRGAPGRFAAARVGSART